MKTAYTLLTVLFGLFLFFVAFTGCKKETGIDINQIIGKYAVISGGTPSDKYIEITATSLSRMSENTPYGIRDLHEIPITFTENEITTYSVNTFSYTYSNGEIVIEDIFGGTEPLVAIRNDHVPLTDEWIVPTTVTDLGPVPGAVGDHVMDMTYYFGSVVTDGVNNGSNYVFKQLSLNGNSLTATEIPVDPSYISSVGYEDNIEFMNDKFLVYYWGNPNSYLYTINTTSGLVESEVLVSDPVGDIYALANDGSDLWGMTYSGIRKFDFINHQWEQEVVIGGAGAFAGQNGLLYLVVQSSNIIQVYDPEQYRVVGAYKIPDHYSLDGLAFLSSDHMLAAVYDYNTTSRTLIRIDL